MRVAVVRDGFERVTSGSSRSRQRGPPHPHPGVPERDVLETFWNVLIFVLSSPELTRAPTLVAACSPECGAKTGNDPRPVCSVSRSGWKLNPVVGAVYAPELYAGKSHFSLRHRYRLILHVKNMKFPLQSKPIRPPPTPPPP